MSTSHRIIPTGQLQTALRSLQASGDSARVRAGAFTLTTRTAKGTIVKGRRRAEPAEESTGGVARWS